MIVAFSGEVEQVKKALQYKTVHKDWSEYPVFFLPGDALLFILYSNEDKNILHA